MNDEFVLTAKPRADKGKAASRRLRHGGEVPAILYGAGKAPVPITLDHTQFSLGLQNEAFYSHVLTVNVDGNVEKAILRDLHRHPHKPVILHADFQRVIEDEEIRVNVPLHFEGEDVAFGVKQQGGHVSHLMTEVEVSCLPGNLPEYIDVDVSSLQLNESIRLSELALPDGVLLVELSHGAERDQTLVTISPPRQELPETEEEEIEGEEGEVGEVGEVE